MWVRNGLQIKGQAMTYIQCHFCNSMVDADMFLLQLCATRLEPSTFLKAVLDRFHVFPWLSLSSPTAGGPEPQRLLDPEQEVRPYVLNRTNHCSSNTKFDHLV